MPSSAPTLFSKFTVATVTSTSLATTSHRFPPHHCRWTLHPRPLAPTDVHESFKEFFAFDRKVGYSGHSSPIMVVQVTELADGIFIGYPVTDSSSLYNFFNTFAQVCRGANKCLCNVPDFYREFALISDAILRLTEGSPLVTFNADAPIRERIFSFSPEVVKKFKARSHSGGVAGAVDFRLPFFIISGDGDVSNEI